MKKPAFAILYLLALAGLFLFWTSCKKDSSTNNPTNPTVAVLTSAAWKYDTAGVDINKDGIIDLGDTAALPSCERDDTFTFSTDSTGVMDEGPTKCNPGDLQSSPFTWKLMNNNTLLTASFNPILQEGVTVLKLDANHFSVYRDSTYLGASYRFILQLKH